MRSFRLIAAAALMASAFPLMMASDASAQVKSAAPDRIGGGGGGGGAIKGPSIGGGGGMVRPPSGWGGGGGRPGWSGGGHHHGSGWSGGYGHRPHYGYGRRWVGPGIGFGTGLLLGGALASQPYYGSSYYYDDDYDDGYVYAAPRSASDEAYCRQRYKSYDPRTRTYLNYDGNRYPCP